MSDSSEIVAYVGGAGGIGALIITAVKWLGGRVVAREDEDKKATQAKLDRAEQAERTISDALKDIKYDVSALRTNLELIGKQGESRAVVQDREIAALRAEMKEQINQLEHRLRQDMQRLVTTPRRKP